MHDFGPVATGIYVPTRSTPKIYFRFSWHPSRVLDFSGDGYVFYPGGVYAAIMTEKRDPRNEIPPSPELSAIFGAGGAVSRAIKGFEPRGEQACLAAAVAHAIAGRRHLMAEAGTGVGKSLGYLVPAALWAARNGKKIVVATHTKALQSQLVKKDLPMVRALLAEQGLPLTYFLLMGSGNYLCLSRLGRAVSQAAELFDEDGSREALTRLREWAPGAESGCRPELPFSVPQRAWEEVCRDGDLCLGGKCAFKGLCFYRKDIARAARADIVVVNQHLYFAGMPLPVFDAVIFDEAHNLEAVAAGFMGLELTDRRVKRFLDDVFNPKSNRGLAHRLARPPANWVEDVKEAVWKVNHASKDFFGEITGKLALSGPAAEERTRTRRVREAGIVKNNLHAPLLELSVLLSQAIPHSQSDLEEAEIKACLKRCLALAGDITGFLSCKEAACAYWVEVKNFKKKHEISLNMAPVDVSDALRKTLFGGDYPVLLTSATLAVDNSFKPARDRLGLDGGLELLLDSPFDYARQAALLVPENIPDPKDAAAYEKAVIEACVRVCSAVEGGVFLLFTSWGALTRAAAALKGRVGGRPLFQQGEELPDRLIAAFRRAGNGVLLATDTFWQGVDVPGQALACVVITRLPFTSPDTPLEETREEWMKARGLDFFADYTLPRAVVKFRQGFGRLIRARKDFGAVVILDPRVRTRRYGGTFLRSIPGCARLAGFKELKAFFSGRRGSGDIKMIRTVPCMPER
ncbi:MAG: ATP-dependent DNA helicase DinG [Elusimicrobia bacterium]|nr:MAG: ATP-dependent DNA helicase DinG [Elusimicrobiota bacterium]KAF0157154.1 MAG: ATP-dependent DNA helicase DinG [Elusimicrobiota bacterium]